jgi:tRNA (guanine37-N1)-methyltransferase
MRILKNIAREIYGEDASRIIGSMDVIGDIAIVKIPQDLLDDRRFRYGEEIIRKLKYIKVVLRQRTPVEGILRLRKFEFLAGEKRTDTIYKEHGIICRVDVERVYFSPRLSRERDRISKLVSEGETVINMFAGVGPYSILIAKRREETTIHSIDINPVAIEYHLTNNILNKVEEKITTYLGDASNIILRYLHRVADRVLMPLPEYAMQYIKYALYAAKDMATLHVYLHVPYYKEEGESIEKAVDMVKKEIEERGYRISRIEGHRVREVGTRVMQICVDTSIVRI